MITTPTHGIEQDAIRQRNRRGVHENRDRETRTAQIIPWYPPRLVPI